METNNDNSQRTWAMLCHLSALIVLLGIPFGNILGPFIVWLFMKNRYSLVDVLGRESMNFQIAMSLYITIAVILAFAFMPVLIGFLLFPVAGLLAVADIALTIVATVRASNNIPYRYPFIFRLIR
ncbi:MAG TPA: DUF4870 domain-containing protein [Deltaproteobacteria bacterium]|nr:DUF4870 domain-containing protein [Deltaproteobacteria bacterium]